MRAEVELTGIDEESENRGEDQNDPKIVLATGHMSH